MTQVLDNDFLIEVENFSDDESSITKEVWQRNKKSINQQGISQEKYTLQNWWKYISTLVEKQLTFDSSTELDDCESYTISAQCRQILQKSLGLDVIDGN